MAIVEFERPGPIALITLNRKSRGVKKKKKKRPALPAADMDLGLAGRVALVTGASRGIGRASAAALAAEGARVFAIARDERRLAELAAAHHGSLAYAVSDLSTEDGCDAAAAAAVAEFGAVDVLVNCAGAATMGNVLHLTREQIDSALRLKFHGYLRLSQLVAPGMKERGWGRIVNVAGSAGTSPTADNLPTSLANIAVHNATRALSDELAPYGVLVNLISPGLTLTDRARALFARQAEADGVPPEDSSRPRRRRSRPGVPPNPTRWRGLSASSRPQRAATYSARCFTWMARAAARRPNAWHPGREETMARAVRHHRTGVRDARLDRLLRQAAPRRRRTWSRSNRPQVIRGERPSQPTPRISTAESSRSQCRPARNGGSRGPAGRPRRPHRVRRRRHRAARADLCLQGRAAWPARRRHLRLRAGRADGRYSGDRLHFAGRGRISLLHPTGHRPPVAAGTELSELSGGVAAAMGAVTALVYADAGVTPAGTADGAAPAADADISRFEAVIALLQYPRLYGQVPGHNPYPLPQNAVPGLELARDGWVCAVAVTPPQWTDFKRMAGIAELEDARFDTLSGRIDNAAETTALIRRFTMQHTVDELVEMGAEYRVPITPVGTPLSLPTLTPYAHRGACVETSEAVTQPRSPFRYHGFSGAPAPLSPVGKHDGPPLGQRRRPDRPVLTSPGDQAKPLTGLRVLEIGSFQAGPIVGMNLAALGADVIKIEAVNRPDMIRFTSNLTVPRNWERAAGFLGPNLGKRDLTADFTQPEGLQMVRALIARSDVVIENFLPRVLDDRKLDYESVASLRPDVLMLRLPAWGLNGPWRNRPGFTYSVNATSGLSDLTGYPDGDPLLTGTIIDPLAAMHSTMILLGAIRRRQLTGEGGLIEVPLCDVAAQLTARAVVTASSTGVEPVRSGNHSASRSPQGIYRCTDGTWLAISVADDRQWAGLAALDITAEWAGDDRFADLAGRVEHRFELDERLTAVCATHDAADLAARLRRAGVRPPCSASAWISPITRSSSPAVAFSRPTTRSSAG